MTTAELPKPESASPAERMPLGMRASTTSNAMIWKRTRLLTIKAAVTAIRGKTNVASPDLIAPLLVWNCG
jgi:hypothetical protein